VKTVCRALGVARSNAVARHRRSVDWIDGRRKRKSDDADLAGEIREAIRELPSYGYRRACALVRRKQLAEGRPVVNVKRVYRVMREAGLLLTRHTGAAKEERCHDGKVAVEQSNRRWCSDGFEIGCDNGERVRVAFALDCCDREAMSWAATTGGIDGHLVRDVMLGAIEQRFGALDKVPSEIEWLSDNGSAYTAHDTRRFAREVGLKPITTPVESPQSNGLAESFVKTFKRDYVAFHPKHDALSVMRQLPLWFEHYNEHHPHRALKMLSPRMFRQKQAQLSNNPCPV
jgi:putative transposase